MSRKSPAFSFYPDSWVLGTMAMNFEEQGIYLRMLCFQWANGPSDANAYANACGLAYQTHVERILSSKFVCIDGAWHNERLEQERTKQLSRSEKAKTSANQRWNPDPVQSDGCERIANAYANGHANAMPSVSVSVSVSESNTSSVSKETPLPPKGKPGKPADIEKELARVEHPRLRQTLQDWLQYKQERREAYKATGLRSLVTQAIRRAEELSADKVCEQLEVAMSSNWAGWSYDRGNSGGNGRGTKPLDSRNDQSVVGTERGWSGFHK